MLALVTLLLIPGTSEAQSPNNDATGRPRIFPSATGAGVLYADTSQIADADGLQYLKPDGSDGDPDSGTGTFDTTHGDWSFQWIRVHDGTDINVGADSPTYQLVDADVGNLIAVRVSFTDEEDNDESLTSLKFGPIPEPAGPSRPPSTLVSNTGQSASATADVSGTYTMGFRLGNHGQGYEISSVSIDLAAAPSGLTVSLYSAGVPGYYNATSRRYKLFDFTHPDSFRAGLNTFTAPAGAYAYPNVNYFIVLSGFGASLSINETTSDAEDGGGEPGAILFDDASRRTSVLRMAVEGSRRDRGILASTYALPYAPDQEIISVGDRWSHRMKVGAADRFLVRGLSFVQDDTTDRGGGFTNPFDLRSGWTDYAGGSLGTTLFSLHNSHDVAGISVWTATQGATVAGNATYDFVQNLDVPDRAERWSSILTRTFGSHSSGEDTPTAPGVTLTSKTGDVALPDAAVMAVVGEPLHAMVQNLGQTDNSYVSVEGGTSKVLSQEFTTGPNATDYLLQGIGVNIEGSNNRYPASPTSVSVAVHAAKSDGRPGVKLFDLVSPTEFGPGLSFFEAPGGTTLERNTSYVLVWTRNDSAFHRLQRTTSNNEDSGRLTGFSIANAYYLGADTGSLSVDSGGNSLELAVYGAVTNTPATGRPIVTPAEGLVGFLQADLSDVVDADGLPDRSDYTYQWFRVDGATGAETSIGDNLRSYQVVNADIGHRIKVRVSFLDNGRAWEVLTSELFGPIDSRHLPSRPNVTLVGNTGQLPAATAMITQQYAIPFRLGKHGQGYDISGVGIDLAAAPSDLTVSLWIGSHPRHTEGTYVQRKLFDFTNPAAFQVGLNTFTAPAGAFAYPNITYYIVLTGFGTSLSIKETTSDAEDPGGEPDAFLSNDGYERALGSTGRWASFTLRSSKVLRLAVEGARRDRGILSSSFAQPWIDNQEIVSIGDDCCFDIRVGPADRYLIRGLALVADNTTAEGGFFGLPLDLKKGSDQLFSLAYTTAQGDLVTGPKKLTSPAGINEWAAPQGATVPGGSSNTYSFRMDIKSIAGDTAGSTRGGIVTGRIFGRDDLDTDVVTYAHDAQYYDTPMATGVTFGERGDVFLEIPHMAVLGEPLVAMVDNFGQTDSGHLTLGDANNKVVSQGFTTGGGAFAHRLVGIGVNIEGSDDSMSVAQIPDGPDSVSVAVHADDSGRPGEKLFDLISPDEYAVGHSFFEAPLGATLKPNTSFVLVWSHVDGTAHRLVKTTSDIEDSGKLTGSGIANAFYHGADLSSLSASLLSSALEIVVYTRQAPRPFVPGGVEVRKGWLHKPPDAEVGDQFRLLFVTYHGTTAMSGNIDDYNDLVQFEAAGRSKRYPEADDISHPVIRSAASEFRAAVCTDAVDARDNTGMTGGIGVPIHWLDGGWEEENRPTLVANSYDEFFGGKWTNSDKGAYVTGNTMHFDDSEAIWTGCLSSGVKHPKYPMGKTDMVVVGTPRDENLHPLGAVDVDPGYLAIETYVEVDGEREPVLKGIYAISPVFTVVD